MNESLYSPMIVEDSHQPKSHVRGDFLASHPAGLTTERPTLQTVNTTIEHVESLVVMTRKYNVGLHTTREALNQLLKLVTGGVSSTIAGVKEFDLDATDFQITLVLSEMVIFGQPFGQLLTDDDSIVSATSYLPKGSHASGLYAGNPARRQDIAMADFLRLKRGIL